MAISTDIINGITGSINHVAAQGDLGEEERIKVLRTLDDINAAIDDCITGFRDTGVVSHLPLARFLNSCKVMKQLLGDDMDKKTTNELRSVLVNAKMFDDDLEVSLGNFKPKLLKVLMLGSPVKSLFSSSRASNKVLGACAKLKQAGEQLSAA